MTTIEPAEQQRALLDESAPRGARRIARERLADAVRARDALARDETDALHDFRVALRRLRSWLRAYRPWIGDTLRKRTRRALRQIADATSTARDAEVAAAAVKGGHAAMQETLRDESRRARRRLERVLQRDFDPARKRAERDLRDPHADPDDPCAHRATMRAVTARLIREHVDAVRRALDAVDASLDPLALHRARIEAKRLRYLLEPLAEGAPGVERLISELAGWQDAMGELHDAYLLRERLGSRRARRSARRARRALHGAAAADSQPDAPLARAATDAEARMDAARDRVRTLLGDGRATSVLRRAEALAGTIAGRDVSVTPRTRR